jgi:hypothetical protein
LSKPKGIWANFATTCHCGSTLTITNGRPDPHDCQTPRLTMAEWQDALGDYYDSGAIGDPPTRY